ncbi:tetratricopeptide repeat protein [Treponema sp. R80B11-R83G3]
MLKKSILSFLLLFIFSFLFVIPNSCAGTAVSAQEYFSIGMAYFDLGKFDEAEKWLNRARQADRTMTASTYNLGRIAYETKRYKDAAKYFEAVLKKDGDNVLALKAAAYSRIKTGDIEIAEKHYAKLFSIVPESADDGYNHALILFALERYAKAEEVLEKYPVALQENKDTMLLYARCQAKLKKVEAIDSFSNWLSVNTDAKVRYEYAQVLEDNALYARALEEYKKALTEFTDKTVNLKKYEIHFAVARVLIIADGNNAEGVTELQTAVTEGFNDIEAVEKLLNNKISAANKKSIQEIINGMKQESAKKEAAKQEQKKETETGEAIEEDEEDSAF